MNLTLDDLIKGEPLTVAQAARRLPGTNATGHLSPATVARWMRKGRRGIRLASVTLGGRRWTTVAALDQFLAQLQEPQESGDLVVGQVHQTAQGARPREPIAGSREKAMRAVGLKTQE